MKGVTMGNKWEKVTTGVRCRKHPTRKRGARFDRYFSIYYKLDGRQHEEGLGWESEGWTEEKVRNLNNELRHNRKVGRIPRTYQEKKAIDKAKVAIDNTDKVQPVTVTILFDEYQTVSEKYKSARSQKRERHMFRDHIKPIIGDIPAKAVTVFDIEEIKGSAARKGLSPSSIVIILSLARQLLDYGIKNKRFSGINPVATVKTPRTDNRRRRFLTEEEAERLLAALKERSLDVFRITLLSLHTGLRLKEIFGLIWSDINFERGYILVRGSKQNDNRFVYMSTRVKAELEAMAEEGPGALLFPTRKGKHGRRQLISKTFFRTVEDLGFNRDITDPRQRVVFLTCRHTFANWLVQKGVDIRVVKELLGHRSLATTERYSSTSRESLRQALATLPVP